MKNLSDQALLVEYSERRSETAFTEVVNRHVDLVYSSALRIVRDPHLAEDVTQAVFLAVAQNAPSLAGHPIIVGWLHRTTQNLASNAVREEVRRRAREQKVTAMNNNDAGSDEWQKMEPYIEEALGRLSNDERNLILLRFFGGKSARDIASLIGIAEGTAQRRLSRAVEKVRRFLQSRNVSIGAASIGISLSAHAVHSAPSGLAAAVSSAATKTIVNQLAAASVGKAIFMSTTHKAIVAVAVTIAVTTGIYEVRQSSQRQQHARNSEEALRQLDGRFKALQAAHAASLVEIENLNRNAERLKEETAELHRLRNDVTQLRAVASNRQAIGRTDGIDPTEAALISWLNKTDAFKQAQHRMPDKAIPELALLTETDWLELAKNHERILDTRVPADDPDTNRKLLSLAREKAKMKFGFLLSRALNRYREKNNDALPSDIKLLRPYFEDHDPHLGGSAEFVSDQMLQRYEVLQSGTFEQVPEKDAIILAEVAPADSEEDTRLVVGKHWLVTAHKDDASYWKDEKFIEEGAEIPNFSTP